MEPQDVLKCYSAKKGWISVFPSSNQLSSKPSTNYTAIYIAMIDILNKAKGKGSDYTYEGSLFLGSIKVQILRVESHRHATFAKCLQQDAKTKGYRYLVYAIAHETDYGIGVGLSNYDKLHNLDDLFPKGFDVAKYIE